MRIKTCQRILAIRLISPRNGNARATVFKQIETDSVPELPRAGPADFPAEATASHLTTTVVDADVDREVVVARIHASPLLPAGRGL